MGGIQRDGGRRAEHCRQRVKQEGRGEAAWASSRAPALLETPLSPALGPQEKIQNLLKGVPWWPSG